MILIKHTDFAIRLQMYQHALFNQAYLGIAIPILDERFSGIFQILCADTVLRGNTWNKSFWITRTSNPEQRIRGLLKDIGILI